MRPTKVELIKRNGTVCMICRRNAGRAIQWHHIQPRYAKGDDSYKNGALVCPNCHINIHEYIYGEDEYELFTEQILMNKR